MYVAKFRKEKLRELVADDGTKIQLGCGPLNASDTLVLQAALQEILGPGMAGLLAVAAGAGVEIIQQQSVQVGLIKLAKDMHANIGLLQEQLRKFAAKTQFSLDGGNSWHTLAYPGTNLANGFDEVFCGSHELVVQWIMFHLELNFKGFFQYVQSALKEQERRLPQNPKT